ncbi:hypothetical protein PAXRUDRAFT_434860 [Paxillus rubicundulus Ve08.2h10]|uniref:Uncharacterized protein n=1 Tax=Paxillus rubicundulus Ve08.2h10 TaxID=930991 RepID=A0A0D0E865_9AGAM|nr:hypothetical protein PAXRUDRAFT_434860 [Paxillus rubicundulus Ve08.2h10]
MVVAPMSWVINAAVTGIAFLVTGDSGIQYLEARTRHELMARDYNAIKTEYDLEQAYLSQVVKLESTLDDARPVVHGVTTKLGDLANVRATISAGICIIQNSLSYAEDPSSQLFVRRIQRLEIVYGCLSRALRYYQVMVRLPESGGGLDK